MSGFVAVPASAPGRIPATFEGGCHYNSDIDPNEWSPVSKLLGQLESDLVVARKGRDKPRVLLLGTILADAKNRRIELRKELTDDDVVEVIRKGIKRRRESAEAYEGAGREELAQREAEEASMLETYLPEPADPAEIRAAVRAAIAAGATQIGAVMGKVLPQFKGRVDGGVVSGIVREELAARG